jgi:hypothetical protein
MLTYADPPPTGTVREAFLASRGRASESRERSEREEEGISDALCHREVVTVGGGGEGSNKGSSSFFASIESETERIQKKKNAMSAQQKQKGMSGVLGGASESSSAGVLLAGR